jgi:GNAT superfamily N-acetyltransferase
MTEEIICNFRNSAELYEAALDLNGKENMQKKETWIYSLSSIERIDKIIRTGEFMVIKRDDRIIGIISYKKGTKFRSLQGDIQSFPDEWEIGGLLIHQHYRGKGYAKQLFKAAMRRLRERGATNAYAIITGTFDESRKGDTREISKPAESLCRGFGGQVVGFGKHSWGPVYKVPL